MEPKIVNFGEVLLRLTPPGYLKLSQTNMFAATFGGSETNCAVSLARFGLKSDFITRFPKNDIAEACLAKQTACDAATYVCDKAVQLHGGTGYMHGTEVERHYRDARILPIGGGATEVLTDLAARLLGYAP